MFAFFRDAGVAKVVMAGKVPKTFLWKDPSAFRPDARALALMKSLADRKDDSILGSVAEAIEAEGFALLGQADLAPELWAPVGAIGKLPPTEEQRRDIAFGWPIAKAIGSLDIGQTVVVRGRAVLALEAIEGTDAAIRRGCALGEKGACVVKVAKPRQDPRFDVPTIGLGHPDDPDRERCRGARRGGGTDRHPRPGGRRARCRRARNLDRGHRRRAAGPGGALVNTLRLAVIGVGHMGQLHARKVSALAARDSSVVLAGVADLDPDRAAEIAAGAGSPRSARFPRSAGRDRRRDRRGSHRQPLPGRVRNPERGCRRARRKADRRHSPRGGEASLDCPGRRSGAPGGSPGVVQPGDARGGGLDPPPALRRVPPPRPLLRVEPPTSTSCGT